MRALIIGASKGIGLETTRQALDAGHHVRALARSAAATAISNPTLEKIRGDALKTEDVEAALVGVDVVIQTLGVGLGTCSDLCTVPSDVTRVLIAAMRRHGVKRLICVTGFGAGDSRASISCLQRLPFQIVFGRAYADKGLQERLIQESGLDWTMARPGVRPVDRGQDATRSFPIPPSGETGSSRARTSPSSSFDRSRIGCTLSQAPVLVN